MVKLHSSRRYVKDPVDYWGKEHTIGNAELAVRLGSPVVFDRRGTVWWYDCFEDAAFNWVKSLSGIGATATLSNEHQYMGDGCAKLTHGDLATNYAQIYKVIGSPSSSRVGISGIVHFQDTVNIAAVLAVRIITGSRNIGAAIRIQQSGMGGLSYGNSTGSTFHTDSEFTHFSDDYMLSLPASYPVKIVVDVANEKYVRCLFGGNEIDMSAYTPCAVDYVNTARIQPTIGVVSQAAANLTAYFDNIVITVDEPA